MKTITKQADLDAFTAELEKAELVFLDTEFMRERTYYSILCLIQAKLPDQPAIAIDALKPGLVLDGFLKALCRQTLLKVFHAGRQDLEIFFNLLGTVPSPVFDTQIAAGFLGMVDQISFEGIVTATTRHKVDKSSQFTDWSRRPLSDKQLRYALNDVILLEKVYAKIISKLEKRGRLAWLQDAFTNLSRLELYQNTTETLWQRIKVKRDDPRTLAVLQQLINWREHLAEQRNVPRRRILKDETLAALALQKPKKQDDLNQMRSVEDTVKGKYAAEILAEIDCAIKKPEAECPVRVRRPLITNAHIPPLEMLKLLLKINAAEADLQPRLLATPEELEDFVLCGTLPAQDYKKELFWNDATALAQGAISLGLRDGKIQKIRG